MKIFGKNIEFSADKDVLEILGDIKPYPAKQKIPEYYKKTSRNVVDPTDSIPYGSRFDADGRLKPKASTHLGFKACVPFMDALISGYILPLWSDIVYEYRDNDFYLSHNSMLAHPKGIDMSKLAILGEHGPEQVRGIPGVGPMEKAFKYINPWKIKTPSGYSCLFIKPMNHFDKRYELVAGIVDTDSYTDNIHFPFILNKEILGEKHLFERGTPFVQIIPFKRESWKSEIRDIGEEGLKEERKTRGILTGMIQNDYRNIFWSKKRYE